MAWVETKNSGKWLIRNRQSEFYFEEHTAFSDEASWLSVIFDLSEVNTLYTETTMSSSSAIYLVGYAVIIVGLALGAHYLEIPTRWIVVGVIVLAGMGLTGLAKSRQGRR